MEYIIGIGLFLVGGGLLYLYWERSNKRQIKEKNLIEKNRNNLIVGNKCNIEHPENPTEKISVEITRIRGHIIYVRGKYGTESGIVVSFDDLRVPINEIYPYE